MYLCKKSHESPLMYKELCLQTTAKRQAEQDTSEAQQVLKRIHYLYKRPKDPNDAYGRDITTWEKVFRMINQRVPRVGSYIIPPEDSVIEHVQRLVSNMRVHHVEACLRLNRLRVPVGQYESKLIDWRKTVLMGNRGTWQARTVD